MNKIKNLSEKFLKKYNLKKGSVNWLKLKKTPGMVKARKEIVFGLLEYVAKDVKCQDKCKYISVGSESLTSDIDITVTGKKTVEIVEKFTEEFVKLFGNTPQEAFDTNLYATTFIFEPESSNYKIKNIGGKTLYIIDTKGKDDRSQLLFALVKLIENSKSEHMRIINKHVPEKILRDAFKLLKQLKNDKHEYIYHIKKMKRLRDKFEAAEGADKTKAGIAFKKQISISNYKSDETYYTQGSFFHVVGKLQSGYKLLGISKAEYINSILENTGFLLENYNNFGLIKEKYLFRIRNAFKSIGVDFRKTKIQDITKILDRILSKIQF